MITDTDRKILRPVIGESYSSDVLKVLAEKKITNGIGEAFSSSFIRLVYLGKKENLDVELAVWELWDRITEKRKRLDQIRQRIKEE